MPSKDKSKRPQRTEPLAPVTTDPRFSTVHSDPRFALPKRRDKTVAIDSRFKRVLTDDSFARKARVDRYGRKLPVDKRREEIRRLYTFEDEEEEEEGDSEEDDARPATKVSQKLKKKEEDEWESESEDEDESEDIETRPTKIDRARGEGVADDDDSTTSGTNDSDDDEEVLESEAEEMEEIAQENDDVPLGDISRRIAVVNLDWDYVKSTDLMVVLSSFLPIGGKIERVSIYPSEFGKERMEREEMEGPPKELFGISTKVKSHDGANLKAKEKQAEEDNEEEITEQTYVKEDTGEEFNSASLRKYQLERLRYFYAIVEFDSPESANAIYTECDGAEFGTTANFFDLRFVPDETTFDDTPRDECTEIPKKYKPTEFATEALQHSKVKLTWDQDDQRRKQVAKEAFSRKDIEDMDLKAYLASDSEDDDEEAKEAYRKLLSLDPSSEANGKSKGKKPVGDMEVTFSAALTGDESKGNEDIFEKEETTIEKYARKEKERKKKRKDKMKLKRTGEDDGDEHSDQDEEAAEGEEDLGFEDPFFEDAEKVNSSLKKAAKAKRKEEKQKQVAELAAKREELEAILHGPNDPDANGNGKLEHFNMASIIKAEKLSKLKGKAAKIMKRKKKNRLLLGLEGDENSKGDGEALQESYQVDVKDPRFNAIYETKEFAIDPTNPKYKKTRAMEEVMQERRKRRVGEDGGVERRKKSKR